jgi:hypothetical protein
MWKTVEETGDHANTRRRVHEYLAGKTYGRHRRLGLAVTVLTAFVGGSVFATLTQNEPSFWIQVATGTLSALACLLSAAQTFAGYETLAEKHKKAGIDFLSVRRRAAVFRQMYENIELTADEKAKAIAEQAAIVSEFDKISMDAPIRTKADYEAVEHQREAANRGAVGRMLAWLWP